LFSLVVETAFPQAIRIDYRASENQFQTENPLEIDDLRLNPLYATRELEVKVGVAVVTVANSQTGKRTVKYAASSLKSAGLR
jgi:hypothetical protein